MSTPKPSTVRVGRRYRANRLNGPYEAIVIGSGIGGLTTAACLSKLGKKVAVFEQHYTAGGFTHSYDRNGYEWDVGVHYIGDMGVSHTLGRRLFDLITDGQLKWAPMDAHYDRIFLGNQHIDLVAGPANFANALKAAFPGEGNAIDTYLGYLKAVSSAMPGVVIKKMLPELPGRPPGCACPAPSAGLPEQNHPGSAGEPDQQSDPDRHADRSMGRQRAATGVRMADGTDVQAPLVISNAGVFNTFGKLLPETG